MFRFTAVARKGNLTSSVGSTGFLGPLDPGSQTYLCFGNVRNIPRDSEPRGPISAAE